MLATAGDVVFTGEPTEMSDAFDARTGKLLWQFATGSGVHGNPVTYRARGRQFVAVTTGWGGWRESYGHELYGAPRGTALVAFALP